MNDLKLFLLLPLLAFSSIQIAMAQINAEALCKKWKLEKYTVFYLNELPAEEEKGDYLHLHPNGTFTSVSSGVFETGNWRLDKVERKIFLTKANEEGMLVFQIKSIKKDALVLIIDDPNDADAQYLNLHFIID